VQQSPIGKRIAGGAFWSIIGNGFGKAFTFIAMILVARILGKEAFGEFGLIRSTAMTFVAFSSFGMGLTATKYIAELLHTDKERTGRIIGLTYVFTFFTSLIAAVAFYLLTPWICETQLGRPELINVMRLGSVLLFLMTFMGTQIAVMTGFQDFRGITATNIITGIFAIPFYIGGTYYYGVYGTVLAVIIITFINVIVNFYFIRKNTHKHTIKYHLFDFYKEFFVLWRFNLPLLLSAIIHPVVMSICQIRLAAQPDGLEALGFFCAAMQIHAIIYFIPTMLSTITFPLLCEFSEQKHHIKYKKLGYLNLCINLIITMLVILPIVFFSQQIMSLFGNDFKQQGGTVLTIICSGIIFHSLHLAVGEIFLSLGMAWSWCMSVVFWCITYYVSSYFFISIGWNISSLAIAYSLSYFLTIIATLILLYYLLRQKERICI
jgi:O-antigen/teichoic acid export membrane protein